MSPADDGDGATGPDKVRGGEFGLIDWIRSEVGRRSGDEVDIGIGDDCAAIRFGAGAGAGAEVLASKDMLMEGRHFRLEGEGSATPEEVGYKALGVNLSDIAAMAGMPVAALVAVALPRDRAGAIARGLIRGMLPLADRFGVVLAGGDTNAWDGPLVVSITLLGASTPPGPVRRSGARVGDAILVTGPLGGSLLGRHLRPEPRILEAIALQRAAPLHAMIDLSDGLASDLGHILDESGGLGAIFEEATLPIHPDAEILADRDGRSALEHALADGEDFELCLTVDPRDADLLLASPPDGVVLHRLGTITAGDGLRLRNRGGELVPIAVRGFDHMRKGT